MNKSQRKIISGGQTGADRAALDWAIENGVGHGGWCPKGRKAEDGILDAKYGLFETPRADYLQRTEWNVKDSDGTVIFTLAPELTGGSKRTAEFAQKHQKPWLHVSAKTPNLAETVRDFVAKNQIRLLNVAGSRASKEPGVEAFVIFVLNQAFKK